MPKIFIGLKNKEEKKQKQHIALSAERPGGLNKI